MEGRPGPFSWSPQAVDASHPTRSHGPLSTREARSALIERIIRMPARPRQNKTPDGAKRRWTPDERATRGPSSDSAAPAKGARAAKRDARFGADRERGTDRPSRGIDWYPGPRNADRPSGDRRFGGQRSDRAERPQRNDRTDRPERGGFERPTPGSRPERGARFDRNAARAPERGDRPERNDRFQRPQRDDRADRPQRGFDRSDRTQGAERPQRGFDRGDRTQGAERPQRSFDRTDRTQGRERFDRPQRSFDRTDRPQGSDRTERPQRGFDRTDRTPGQERSDRRDDRPARTERPQYQDRTARPQRQERFERDDRPRQERPRTEHFPARNPNRDRAQHDRRPATSFSGREERTTRFEAPQDVVLARLEGDVVTAADVAGRSFADLGLGEQITKALADLGATSPFPIQAATIPAVLQGRNVLGRGRTGSGKTIAFGAALVERLLRNWAAAGRTGTGRRVGRAPRALILAPTRELALQIDRTVQPIARSVGLYTTQIVGGVPQGRQVGALVKGVDIVIGTPGRIEDLLEQGRLDLSAIEIAVLDEADHMADLGFLEPIQRLLRRVPAGGQRLMFSATLDAAVAQLVAEFLPNPDVHEVADPAGSVMSDHRVLVIEQGEKLPVLAALVGSVARSLVFARTRAFAEQLADDLDGEGVKTESLHGDLNQGRRTRNLARFSEGKVSALVATDVAARGIHVDDIELVVHADSAEDYKTYLHRSGRTGRAGASGTVVTLITARRRRRFTELLERAGIEAEFVVLRAGEDPVEALRSAR
jgi:superfamily II DNA/RNA helicase